MTNASTPYLIPAPPVVSLAVENSPARFPVRRVYCVGRNYAAHAREMGANPDREPPFFFCKPREGIVPGETGKETPVVYPSRTRELHHEIEMVVAIGLGGANISADDALGHVWGYGLGLDLTRRDIQSALKAKGHPWEMGKAFDQSAPIGSLVPVSVCGHPSAGLLLLTVNGETRQQGDLADMIWSVAETIAQLSSYVTLAPGDLIFTGTPEGVGPVNVGDVLVGSMTGLPVLRVKIVG